MNKDLKIIPGEGVKTILQTTRSRYGKKKLIIPKVASSKALVPYKNLGSSKSKISFITKVGKTFKKGLKITGVAAAATGAAYIAGASSRRYNKAPKFGEGRELRDLVMLGNIDPRSKF